jgi:DNA topoisomerase-3
MAKSLVITEKPSVARDIVEALGGFTERDGYWESEAYVVTFSVGHILELLPPEEVDPQYKRWTLDTLPILPESFKLRKKAGQSERLRVIKALLDRDDVDTVVNACDAGREGELIFREILQYLGSRKPTQRLWLQSMTRGAIRAGFERLQPGTDYDNLGAAAACRSQSDWLIGMNATRALTRRLKSRKEKTAWSAGRVQTPTLALVVDRELEVLSHVARPYSRVLASLEAAGQRYSGTWFDPGFTADPENPELRDDRIFDERVAQALVQRVQNGAGTASETRKPSRETAPPLFDLTALQREGNRRFGWSARRTLNAAQRCYEGHKILTYPRTSSRALPNDYRATIDGVLQAFLESETYGTFAQALLQSGLENTERTFDDSKVSDHFAIVPTGTLPPRDLAGDDARLFDLVTRRFLSTFYPPAVWNRVERITEIGGAQLRSRARTLDEPGWRSVTGVSEQEDPPLPPLVPGQADASGIGANVIEAEQTFERTKPPPRYTEARLLSLMENAGREIEDEEHAEALRDKGIGTSATRADIIENLIAKSYIVRGSKALRPTVKGIRLVDVLKRIHIDRLASPALTGQLEHHLSQVERGHRTAEQFMDEVVRYTEDIVDRARTFDYEELYQGEQPIGPCPACNRPVYERSWFYRCEEVPGIAAEDDCPFRIWKDKAGRYIDRETATALVTKGETAELEGFSTRDGRIYSGVLKLDDLEVTLIPVAGSTEDRASDTPEYEIDERPLGPCPMGCGSDVIETPTHFVCRAGHARAQELERERQARIAEAKAQGQKRPRVAKSDETPCPFTLPRTVCKREITRDEAELYLRDQKTPLLTDFTSRFGRPFAAMLTLRETGRHGFEFAPRTRAGADGAAGEGAAEGDGAAARKPSKRAATKVAAEADASADASATAAKSSRKSAGGRRKVSRKAAAGRKKAARKAARKKVVRKRVAPAKDGSAARAGKQAADAAAKRR